MFEKVREAIEGFNNPPHLLSVTRGERPRAIQTRVEWDGDRLVVGVGKRSLANIAGQAAVTLLWSAADADQYSLLIDGEASIEGAGEDARVVISVTRAVLHRAVIPDGPLNAKCGSDCVTLYE